MTNTQIKKRIAKMKADTKDTWLASEHFFCKGCGEGFRYIENLNIHEKKCFDIKYAKL